MYFVVSFVGTLFLTNYLSKEPKNHSDLKVQQLIAPHNTNNKQVFFLLPIQLPLLFSDSNIFFVLSKEVKRIKEEGKMEIKGEYVSPKKETFLKVIGKKRNLSAPHLAVTRSLGHTFSSISHEPEVIVRERHKTDQFIVLCSDGVSDRLEPIDVMNVVADCGEVNLAAERIIDECLSLCFGDPQDNTSACVVFL